MSGSDDLKLLFGVNINDIYFIDATYEEHMKAHMDHKAERTKCNEFGKHGPHTSKYLNIREAVRSKMIHWLYSFADGNLRNLKCMKNFKYDEENIRYSDNYSNDFVSNDITNTCTQTTEEDQRKKIQEV